MSQKKKKDEQQYIEELLRLAMGHISPIKDYEQELKNLQDKKFRNKLYKKHPECFLKIKRKCGKEFPYFSLCNSNGIIDPEIIKYSLHLAKVFRSRFRQRDVDYEDLEATVRKLNFYLYRYQKQTPKPPYISSKIGADTRKLHQFDNYKETVIKGKE